MKNKLGRNDICGCGRGLKYKKCCLPKGLSYIKDSNNNTSEVYNGELKQFFSQYYYIDLASFFGAVSLNVSNHGKNVRLDFLTLAALMYGSRDEKKSFDLDLLQKFLNTKYRHHHFEDPVDNFFTRNICYQNGNATVYEGIFTYGADILQNQITVLNNFAADFPIKFLKESGSLINFFLEISCTLSIRFEHSNNMYEAWSNIPNEIEMNPQGLEPYKLWFENTQIQGLCKFCKIETSVLDEFCINPSAIIEDELHIENNDNNPLIQKPLIRTHEGLCIISPTNLLICLVHSIWTKVINYELSEKFVTNYHRVHLAELLKILHKLDYKLLINLNPTQDIRELPNYLIYGFDTDKILLLVIQYEMLEDYDVTNITSMYNVYYSKFYQDQVDDIIKQNHRLFENKNLQVMCITSTVGRNVAILSDVEGKCILGSIYDIFVILNSGINSSLDLWYYSKVEEQFSKNTEFAPLNSSLDRFSLYYKNKSFYMSDDQIPDYLAIVTDGNFELVKQGVLEKGQINALYNSDQHNYPVYLTVEKYNDYVYRYYNIHRISERLEFHIPNENISIWVKSKLQNDIIPKELKNAYWEYCEAICFWLSEISMSLSDIFSQRNSKLPKVVDIVFDLGNHILPSDRDLKNVDFDFDKINKSFSINLNEIGFSIEIPVDFGEVAILKNNTADRILILNLLKGFQLLLEKFGIILNDNQIDEIIERHAPLGLKKYLLIMSSSDNLAFDNRYLNFKLKTIFSGYNYELLFDKIISLLEVNCPPVGEITDKSEKLKLCEDITLLLAKEISDNLKKYNSFELLENLLRRYEVTLHHNEIYRLRIPTLMHCYQDKWDIQEEIKENAELNDKSTLALRNIIEYVASENSFGKDVVTTEVIDDLVSLITMLNFFGHYHDIIEFDLFETKMWILKSDRIGHNLKEIEALFMEKFTKHRSGQLITDAIEYYYSDEEKNSNKFKISDNLYEKLSDSFLADYNISHKNLRNIVDYLIEMPFEIETDVVKMEKTLLIDKIYNYFSKDINDDHINSGLDFLSLKNRNGMLTKLPAEYDLSDVFPWKFNRRLSYLYKPLIEFVDEDKKEYILYSPRHLDKSFRYLASKLSNGQFKGKSKGMVTSVVGEIAKLKGKNHQQNIVDFFSEFPKVKIYEEFNIGTDSSFDPNANLGDIDVLVIDFENKVILCIESKNTEESKNMREFAQEAKDYLGENGYVFKHRRRHNWAQRNVDRIGTRYQSKLPDFEIKSCMITKHKLAIQFMSDKKIDFPIFTLGDFENNKMLEIYEKISNILLSD